MVVNTPTSGARLLLLALPLIYALGTDVGVAVCQSGREVAAALADPTIHTAFLPGPLTLADADWAEYAAVLPVLVDRNFTFLGPGGRFPMLDLAHVRAKVRLGNGTILTFRNLLLHHWRYSSTQAPGVDLLTAVAPGESALVRFEECFFLFLNCFPIAFAKASGATVKRPPQLPGDQVYKVPIDQSDCVNNTDAPLLDQCYAYRARYADFAMQGADIQPNGSPGPNRYSIHIIDTGALCLATYTLECLDKLGPIGCVLYTLSLSPPPPSTGGAYTETAAAEAAPGGGSTSSSPLLAAVLGGVLGGVALVILLVASVLWVRRGRRSAQQRVKSLAQDEHSGISTDEQTSTHPHSTTCSGTLIYSTGNALQQVDGSSKVRQPSRSTTDLSTMDPTSPSMNLHVAPGCHESGLVVITSASPLHASLLSHAQLLLGRSTSGGGMACRRSSSGLEPESPQGGASHGVPPEPFQWCDGVIDDTDASDTGMAIITLQPITLGRGSFGRVVAGVYRGQRVAVKLLADTLVDCSHSHEGRQGSGVRAESWSAHNAACAKAPAVAAAPALAKDDDAGAESEGHEQPPAAEAPAHRKRLGLHDMLRREVEVLGRCEHPNIVRLLAACLTPPRLCLVMELMETSLQSLIYTTPARVLPLPTVLHVCIQVARGLEYLHPTITHRDLKPANVLINAADSPWPVAKLADFGLSRMRVATLPTMHPEAGTPAYLAPECYEPDQTVVTHHADLYSLGVLMWAMLTGQEPWKGLTIPAVALKIAVLGERLPLGQLSDRRCPPQLRKIVQGCWEADPRRRPAAAEVAKELEMLQRLLLTHTSNSGRLSARRQPGNSGDYSRSASLRPSRLGMSTSLTPLECAEDVIRSQAPPRASAENATSSQADGSVVLPPPPYMAHGTSTPALDCLSSATNGSLKNWLGASGGDKQPSSCATPDSSGVCDSFVAHTASARAGSALRRGRAGDATSSLLQGPILDDEEEEELMEQLNAIQLEIE